MAIGRGTVKVRFKKIKSDPNMESIYLDFYPAILNPIKGAYTRRKFLGLRRYIKPKGSYEKDYNKNVAHQVDVERVRVQSCIVSGKGGVFDDVKERVNFIDFFSDLVKEKELQSTSTHWRSTLYYLSNCFNGVLPFERLSLENVEVFRSYIQSAQLRRRKGVIASSTAASYFTKFIEAVKQAYYRDFIPKDLSKQIKGIDEIDTIKEWLFPDEIKLLKNTPFEDEELKSFCLFLIYTGLRKGDASKVKWSEFINDPTMGWTIPRIQGKTGNKIYHPINNNALDAIGGKVLDSTDLVFPWYKQKKDYNGKMREWIKKAGIKKHITLHCFRHTYACLLQSKGYNHATIQQLMGHSNISTTMRYIKLLDSQLKEASDSLSSTI